MSDANIRVEVDTSAIDAAITTLDSALGRHAVVGKVGIPSDAGLSNSNVRRALRSGQTFNTFLSPADLRQLSKEVAIVTSDDIIRSKGLFSSIVLDFQNVDTPTFNRNWRTVLNRLPLGRELTQTSFGIRRLQASAGAGGLEAIVGVAATLLILFSTIQNMRRQFRLQNQQYKNLFLEYKPDLTRDEFVEIRDQNATLWDRMGNWVFGVN